MIVNGAADERGVFVSVYAYVCVCVCVCVRSFRLCLYHRAPLIMQAK